MALTYSEALELSAPAHDFSLPGVDGRTYSLSDFASSRALVVIFMCNHCPYVQAVDERINQLAKSYQGKGVSVVGINPNDAVKYPDDSFDAMKKRSRERGYAFAYLQDESQEVARAYGAVCTPDFFVYENSGGFKLRYRGRLDDCWKDSTRVQQRDLAQALDLILLGHEVFKEQAPSMGCSIKWK